MKRNRIALLVYVLLISDVVTLGAATGPKLQPSGYGEQGVGRYLVTLSDDASEDAAAMKRELAGLYGARLAPDASPDVRQFTVTMMPARARLLSADPRVIRVAEVPLNRETPPVAPASVSSARFKPRQSGFGDNGQSGTYTYDGVGNITAIGADTFAYDGAGRLTRAVIRGVEETYTYDAFGNRKTATGAVNCLGQTTCAQSVTVDSTSNHLTTINGGNVTYDAAGNIAAISGSPGAVYTYDGSGMMIEATVGSDDRQFLYTADDERIAVKQGVSWTWTVRDLSGKVLREFTSLENGPNFAMTNWQWVKDYVWRDGLLLATTTPAGTLHYHLDHLGTPRLVTDNNGVKVAEHAYYPFGAEINITPHESPEEAMKFTGHERDIVAGDGRTLDYMHARYYSATVARFLSVDPVLGDPTRPQTWNRYAYVHNNPLTLTDPDGRCEVVCWGLIILGGVLLSGDVANAPAPGDKLYPSPGPAGAISGSSQSVGFAFSSGAFGHIQTVTRYMSDGEAEAVRRTGNVPNTDAQGNPRPTHVTTDKPLNDPAAAQKKYELPTTPTQRATVPKDRVPGGLGPTPDGRPTTSGGGSQSATNQPIPVKPSEIKPMNENFWDRVISWFR